MRTVQTGMKFLSLLVICVAPLIVANAQVTTGNIRGTVTDPNGALVSGANVTLTKRSTNSSVTAQTSGSGQFEFTLSLIHI